MNWTSCCVPYLALALGVAACHSEATPSPSSGAKDPALHAEPGSYRFAQADLLKPRMDEGVDLDPYLAPLVYLETTSEQSALVPLRWSRSIQRPAEGGWEERPTVYFRDERLELGERGVRQLTFFWFLAPGTTPEPVSHGARITFHGDGKPAVIELPALRGDDSQIYLSNRLVGQLGALPEGADGEFRIGPAATGPYVYLPLDSRSPRLVHCRCEATRVDETRSVVEYELVETPGQGWSSGPGLGPDFQASIETLRALGIAGAL